MFLLSEPNIQIERYAAFLYAECLRTLPAVARKWWHASNTRQAQIIDKITMNNVSPILCQEELSALVVKKDKEKDNMHVCYFALTVYFTTLLNQYSYYTSD